MPDNERDLKAYFVWAMHARAFGEAERVFSKLSSGLKGSSASLYFANILQRQGRFTEAQNVLKSVHAYMLAKPATLNPFQHWSLIRRYGELVFLRETASIYKTVRQPTSPEGVIIVAPRNIDQLRKYPIVALMEMKRLGWAVVPIVEGLLPNEPTGIRAVDALNGCITIEMDIRPDVQALIGDVEGFVSEPDKGVLRWGNIDLAHSILEDARVSRRAFNVDLTCPSLATNMDRLAHSTRLFARAIHYARETFESIDMPCGSMSLFNSRLPDSLFRAYCEEFGNDDTFFCLHSANGYENYFTNFSTRISTRCVVRNVTKYPEVRSASLPVPSLFNEFYEANRHQSEEAIARVEHHAQVRRTTGNAKDTDPDAVACERRIMEWRANGGNVACLFGRVVCDSAVPFDGGPVHRDLAHWIEHSIEAVRGTNTMLLIKPHPHELNEQIATYLNEYFTDLIKTDLPDNVVILGHRWFDIQLLKRFVDLGIIYNGTTIIELALLDIPAVMCGYFAPIDYPVGQIIPKNRKHYENLLQFRSRSKPLPDMRARAALWLDYMSNSTFAADYRYHSRPITNKAVYPPYWIDEDVHTYKNDGDSSATILAKRAIGRLLEPAG